MNAIVQFKNVSKTYDGLTNVVTDITLDVERGEFLTLLGPSGSGKTTSLMMLAGFEAPTSGQIFLENRVLSKLPPHKRDIGMVFQNYALFPHMSVGDNIAFPLQVRKYDRQDIASRVARALDMVRLPNILDRKPAQLSGGQQQRVALARALVYEPKIVLMDEPLGALDRQLRESMQREIKAIHARVGVTVVYVTHDQSEALTLSDRIAIFNHGAIEQLADPRTIYDHPQNAFVADFIGENNLLTGVVKNGSSDQVQVEVPGIGIVTAQSNGKIPNGAAAVVSIRPEKVRPVDPIQPRIPANNAYTAKIEDVIYFGDHGRLVLRLRGGQAVVSKVIDNATWEIGGETAIEWSPNDCLAFEASSNQTENTGP